MADRIKRASYRDAVHWIAYNDEPGSKFATDLEEISTTLTVTLTADLFGVDAYRIARDVIRVRQSKEWRTWAGLAE